MQTLERAQGESFFLTPKDEAARNMTLGELMGSKALEIKVMEIEPGKVRLCIDLPEAITVISSGFNNKQHGSDFPPHLPLQQGD